MKRLREMQDAAADATRNVTNQPGSFKDPKTGHVFEYDQFVDGVGNVVRLGEPKIVSFDPVTKAQDEAFIKENLEWTSKGAVSAASKLAALDASIAKLLDPNSPQISGPITGPFVAAAERVPLFGKMATRLALPEVKNVQDAVTSVGQETIREVFGSNPAQAEAQRLLDRLYDTSATEEENARRVTRFRNLIADAAAIQQAKDVYFKKNGTISGFSGPDLTTLVAKATADVNQIGPKGATPQAKVSAEAANAFLSGE
jgi:hypothetical protein